MDKKQLLNQLQTKMQASVGAFENNLKGLRVGRALASFLDPVQVEIYGDRQPISQVATISTPDARTITVQVWDKAQIKAVEKGIIDAKLGLNPSVDGAVIRINIPALSQERRKELVKIAAKYCEDAKIAVRHIRKSSIDELKKNEKDALISEDDLHNLSEDVQKITNDVVAKIEKILTEKEKEILSI